MYIVHGLGKNEGFQLYLYGSFGETGVKSWCGSAVDVFCLDLELRKNAHSIQCTFSFVLFFLFVFKLNLIFQFYSVSSD